MTAIDEIAAFVQERNALLIEGDLDKLALFRQKHNPGASVLSREVQEIALHKARTAVSSLPAEIREASAQWLKQRGYSSLA
jgi:hypothetical protein